MNDDEMLAYKLAQMEHGEILDSFDDDEDEFQDAETGFRRYQSEGLQQHEQRQYNGQEQSNNNSKTNFRRYESEGLPAQPVRQQQTRMTAERENSGTLEDDLEDNSMKMAKEAARIALGDFSSSSLINGNANGDMGNNSNYNNNSNQSISRLHENPDEFYGEDKLVSLNDQNETAHCDGKRAGRQSRRSSASSMPGAYGMRGARLEAVPTIGTITRLNGA